MAEASNSGNLQNKVRERLRMPLNRKKFSRRAITADNNEVIAWWENRRFFYNIAVLITGVVMMLTISVVRLTSSKASDGSFPIFEAPGLLLLAILFYAIVANILYCLGWVVEAPINLVFPKFAPVLGQTLFCFGLLFSVVATFSPATYALSVLIK